MHILQTLCVLSLAVAFDLASLAGPAHAASAATEVAVGQTFLTTSIDPGDGNAGWALTSHGIAEKLYSVDQEGRLVPVLAEAIASADSGSWMVTLQEGRQFSDGSPVTAADVAAALGRTNARNPAAQATGGVLAFQEIDKRRLRITPERPVPVLAALLAEWPMVIYKPTPDGFIFTGPFTVKGMKSGAELRMVPNPRYPGAAARPNVFLKRFSDAQSLALAFEAGELDLAFNLPVEALPRLRARQGLTVKSFPVAYQYMMWLNTRRVLLADTRVRRALDLAIDREMLRSAVRGGQVATGAYAAYFPFAATAPRPFDRAAAEDLLNEAGWMRGNDGVRRKDGKPLALVVYAYPQRPDLVTFLPVLKALYGQIGVEVETRLTEAASQLVASHDFDLLLWAQHTAPAGDPAFFLNMFLRTDAGNNHTGYSSARFDALLDQLASVSDPARRVEMAREAQAILAEDAPVSFLLTPTWHVGLSERLKHYEPWGSDYYIIRPDLTLRE
jgi:peptide/nickel transport system substrate-binding protein